MMDPSDLESRGVPKSEQDLFVGAANTHVLAYDNISSIPGWFSDALCRVATGGAFATRELYTNGEEAVIKVRRPTILNGIPFTVSRPDLLDRAIVLVLPFLPPGKRRDEKEFWAELERVRPMFLGLVATALSRALRDLDTVQLGERPRMADLVRWTAAGEEAFGWPAGTFQEDFQTRRQRSLRELADDPVVEVLRRVVRKEGGVLSVTATELLERMNSAIPPADRPANWPRAANRLAGQVRALAPALRELGLHVDLGQRRARDNHKLIILRAEDQREVQGELDIM